MHLLCSPRVFATRVIDRNLGDRVLPAARTGGGGDSRPRGGENEDGYESGREAKAQREGGHRSPGCKAHSTVPRAGSSKGVSVGRWLQALVTLSQRPVSPRVGSRQPSRPRLVEAGTGGRRCGWSGRPSPTPGKNRPRSHDTC